MRRIFKHSFEDGPRDVAEITVAKGTKMLSVINQYDKITVYYETDPNEKETTSFRLLTYGIGHALGGIESHDGDYQFLGTVALLGGNFVGHVYFKEV